MASVFQINAVDLMNSGSKKSLKFSDNCSSFNCSPTKRVSLLGALVIVLSF